MRKNILIFGHNDGPQFIDVCNQYVRLFDPKQYEVTVAYLTGADNPDTRQRNVAENILFLNFTKKEIRGLKIKAILCLLKLCKEKQFEIIICHRYKPTYIMMLASLFCKIPLMIFVMHELGTMGSWGRKLMMRLFLRKNMLLAGVANAVRDDMKKSLPFVPPEQIITLYNSIDVDWVKPQLLSRAEARQQFNLTDDQFVFGNLARLVPNKDHGTLIKAFALIKPNCPNAKLLILGAGDLEQELKALTEELGLSNDIIFAGFVNRAFTVVHAFDCFVLSSVQEAFGRVLLEAMIAQLPIIATAVHGIPEVMGDTGLLVKARNAEEFAEAMRKIYFATPEQRAAYGKLAYQHMQLNFSVEQFHKQFWGLPAVKRLGGEKV